MIIRDEAPGDVHEVRRVNELAFGQPAEANLVDALRRACPDSVSLVAQDEGRIVGHILFTPVTLEGYPVGMGLAPLAVVPERQRQGIGSALVRHGLGRLRAAGCPFVVVVGHPGYYPRFGFERASLYGFVSQWQAVSDAAFMAIVFDHTAMAGATGVVRYRPEFDAMT